MGMQLLVRSVSDAKDSSGFAYAFDQERVLVGRAAGADVRIPHPTISVEHALFRQHGQRWVVEDKGSTNGTWVNDVRLPPGRPKALDGGDRVRLGAFMVTFHPGVAVREATSVERTASLARRMLRELRGDAAAAVGGEELLVMNGPDAGKIFPLPTAPAHVVIGRGENCTVALVDADASREHAEILCDVDGFLLKDLGSKNGVLVNDRAVTERRLKHRDEILVGSTLLMFEDPTSMLLDAVGKEPDQAFVPMKEPPAAPEAPAGAGEVREGEGTVEPAANDAVAAASATTAVATEIKPVVKRPAPALKADYVIYALAGTVFIVSVGLLYWFLRTP
jgi:pSer/pThr/pTyr-binding forkhead associated (FHA) protein